MEDILGKFGTPGIVPVVKIDDAKDAVALGKALIAGGLPCAEITFRTNAAEEVHPPADRRSARDARGRGHGAHAGTGGAGRGGGREVHREPRHEPEGGSVLSGPRYPDYAGCLQPDGHRDGSGLRAQGPEVLPGRGLRRPRDTQGDLRPFGMVKFIPTGGIGPANLNEYLSFPKVLACGGSWMVKTELISEGNFDEITRLTREAVNIMLGFSLAHVGINTPDAEGRSWYRPSALRPLRFPLKEGNSSNFAGTPFEVMKRQGRGGNGHIAVQTNSIPRAMAYLGRLGIAFDRSSATEVNGVINAIYFQEEIGGFAFHLLQRK